jgi:hypothetical protein
MQVTIQVLIGSDHIRLTTQNDMYTSKTVQARQQNMISEQKVKKEQTYNEGYLGIHDVSMFQIWIFPGL